MYQASVGSPVSPERPAYDFDQMEAFAREEKTRLGIQSPGASPFDFRARVPGHGHEQGAEGASLDDAPRTRHRKLSQSTPHPRRGKMALFEQPGGAPPPALAARAPHLLGHYTTPLSAVPSYDQLPGAGQNGYAGSDAVPIPGASTSAAGQGHDRPYRFSFYSNALSATIHARSLSELPAEGQSFEDLFLGRPGSGAATSATMNANASSRGGSYGASPIPGPGSVKSTGLNGRFGNMGTGSQNPENCTWWLDVLSPTDEEMKLLSKVFNIHPLTTEDIQMEETREKIELFRNYYFVCFRGFDQDPYSPTYLEPLNMYIIVFREGILSFHYRPTPHPQNVRRRIKQLKDYISVTSDWISYALIDDITDAFGPLIQGIEYEVDSIDELVLILKDAEQSDMLRRIGTCRKKVMGLLRLMGNKADVVKGLAKRCNENWRVAPTSDIGLYLSDIQDHLITMTQNLNHYEKILSRSHSNYLAQISIEMTEANNQINDVLSKLTALGTVLIPMNLVTGLWGMNVHVPGQFSDGYTWFGAIIGALAAFALIAGYSTYKLMVRR
ncbi:cora-domain-containing protein [Obba rivulosa]|uniref:Cora-domain-containing protein n=1 Tax=Obba rivulosa TaxID=1052685 RepID=A0A8E2DUN8_9APHY|nr:cora-domain-containing protein [Obba rivulosa]